MTALTISLSWTEESTHHASITMEDAEQAELREWLEEARSFTGEPVPDLTSAVLCEFLQAGRESWFERVADARDTFDQVQDRSLDNAEVTS